MKQTFFIPILILVFSFSVFAQTENPCSKIKINSPETVSPDEVFKVSASFENETQPSTSEFNWIIIKGNEVFKIKESGIIEIDSKQMDDGGTIILLAESTDGQCQNTAMTNVFVMHVCGLILTIDEYSELEWNDERARLDNVILTMQNIKDSELFAFISFNKRTSQTKRKTYLKKMLDHLTVTRSFEKNRLTFMISQSDEKRVYFQPIPKSVTSVYDSCEDCLIIKAEDFDKLTELFR